MTDFDALLEAVLELRRDLDQHKIETRNLIRVGPVLEDDPEKGVRVDFGAEGAANKDHSHWTKPSDRTGVSSYRPKPGETVMVLAMNGDLEQALVLPLTHTDAKPDPKKHPDETVHYNRDGQRNSVRQGHAEDHTEKAHSRTAGDKRAREGKRGGGGDMPHELQRQLAGVRANLSQLEHNVAGLHDATSKFREIVQKAIPAVQMVEPLLKGDASSLEAAVQGAAGKVESYIAKSLQQAVAKLTNGLLDNVLGLVAGFASGQLGGLLDQIEDLASLHGLEDLAGAALDEARGLVEGAVGGAIDAMTAPLDALADVFAGTPGEAAFALLRGQLGGALGQVASVAAGIGDLVDGQKNLTKGLTRSYRLGGYDGVD